MLEKLTHIEPQDAELLARWRYGTRQREVLSVLNEIFDQYVSRLEEENVPKFSDGNCEAVIASSRVVATV